MDGALTTALKGYGVVIGESSAYVTRDPLSCIVVDGTQMGLLLNNLLGNTIRSQRDEAPKVHIGVTENAGEWLFLARDNEIDIDNTQKERIFQMFQRLHTRGECKGAGIGLAVARKMVERHGWRIWVESEN
ncbi:MAG: hypothetical protein GX307_08490 [Euryarchaeota archaeon]|nr:hypothetical protein [Euryarchaeota archaeon]